MKNGCKEIKKVKLEYAEKSELMSFYKENEVLLSNTADRKGRSDAKQKLVELFDQRYDLDFLEESFYALCTAFQREHRKYQQVSPTKNWKFYNN